MAERTGVLLINLGTPDSPATRDVRRYLREFLSDPRVIDIAALPRWLLVNLVIAPFRSPRSAAAYRKVWTDAGSPLLSNGIALRDGVAAALGDDWVVALGMRYGNPSIGSALARLVAADVDRIVALPLFPQWAESSTGSAVAKLEEETEALAQAPPVETLPAFFDDPGWIESLAEVAREPLAATRPDHVLFSYHGLPERQIQAADPSGAHCLASPDCCDRPGDVLSRCYRAQCYATTRAVSAALGLDPARVSTAFQSRLGRTPWIRPYTDVVLPELAAGGVKRLAVLCPSFVADCLETIEEIGIRAREQWRELGGDVLTLAPCPNAHPRFVEAVASLIRRSA
ncbi:MAG: ferrochelatase [Myxococcales bacterium]|nr:ferrochelatase [Myxococcales bacterium]